MSRDNLFIGIDSGTQGTKAVVLSEDKGKVVADAYCSYELMENERGGKEQHPDIWIDGCRQVIGDICAHRVVNPEEIRAIGVSGQQHGMVALDSDGGVIRPAKLWCDTETISQCKVIAERLGGMDVFIKETGNMLAVGFTASKVLWLKEHEPENYDRLSTILLPHDYINFWLTGRRVTECGDASGTAYFDVRKRTWSEKVLLAIDDSGKLLDCLPELIESDQACGTVKSALAQEIGLPEGMLVASGGGDNMMAAIGTGNIEPGIVTASLGTSGTIYGYSDRPIIDTSGELAAFCSSTGGWLPLVCTMNVTVATELTRRLLDLKLQEMNHLIDQAPIGSGGLLLLPYFQGERTPPLPEVTATLTGISTTNYTPENICRAAMEGVTFGMRYGLDLIKRNGINPQEIRLVGGGAKSSSWRQMVADIFNCRVEKLENEEAGAVGAAIQSLWCWKRAQKERISLKDLTDRYIVSLPNTACEPDFAQAQAYAEIYDSYLRFNRKMFGLS